MPYTQALNPTAAEPTCLDQIRRCIRGITVACVPRVAASDMHSVLPGHSKCCLQPFAGLRKSPCVRSLPSSGHNARSVSTYLRGLSIRAAGAAEPAVVPVVSFDGETKGSETMVLKVASSWTAKGVVHRCMVTEMQNKRQVRGSQDSSFSSIV